MMKDADLKGLLIRVKELFFHDHQITMLGKFEWLPLTERQITRFKKKTGKRLKYQHRYFKITEEFIDYTNQIDSTHKSLRSTGFRFYHLLISDINQEDSSFYIIGDNCVGPLIGEKVRYKFRLESINGQVVVQLIENKMIAIR